MGNGIAKLGVCFTCAGETRREKEISILLSDPLDEGQGHSFVYIRPDSSMLLSSKVHSDEATTFRTISGASVSANTSTPLSTASVDLFSYNSVDKSATFESSTSFSSVPLQSIPRNLMNSGPISGNFERISGSGPLERGFMSGPLDRGLFSGPMEKGYSGQFQRSFSHGGFAFRRNRSRKSSLILKLRRAISKRIGRNQNSLVTPIKAVKEPDWIVGAGERHLHNENLTVSSLNFSSEGSLEDDDLQWAQGKAGEDRVHVVVSEEHGWVFVGIYDGFNGPDAPDFLLSNLYSAVHKEVHGLLSADTADSTGAPVRDEIEMPLSRTADDACSQCVDQENYPCPSGYVIDLDSKRKGSKKSKNKYRDVAKRWEENQRRWKCVWDKERLELHQRLEQLNGLGLEKLKGINHSDVLKALSEALRKTEEAYLETADKMLVENPELALMGSCVLVMLMKGEDVYVMNVGDSRAVLAQKAVPDYSIGRARQDLECIDEETLHDLEGSEDVDQPYTVSLSAVQLTVDHSTNVEEEVERIKNEHKDDAGTLMNDRVKGSLKVTRAFGAGFLKQPRWNNALLEMFRIDYIGDAPYLTCFPHLHHHRLEHKDQFLILSSDGLYQYFTNEEAVAEIELFIALQPEGDPAQHLVEEVLFRAANKAGMDFHELLEIPQGDRRRYHDDVSIIIISLEGRIWRSCV